MDKTSEIIFKINEELKAEYKKKCKANNTNMSKPLYDFVQKYVNKKEK